MSYIKQNFTPNSILTAEQMNHIEDGIVEVQSKVTTLTNTVSEIDNALFERTNGESIYDPDTMYITGKVLILNDNFNWN